MVRPSATEKKKKLKVIPVYVSEQTHRDLKRTSAETGITMSNFFKSLLNEYQQRNRGDI